MMQSIISRQSTTFKHGHLGFRWWVFFLSISKTTLEHLGFQVQTQGKVGSMQGGLFDLSPSQKTYLLIAEFMPALITTLTLYKTNDYLITSLLIQLFYLLSSLVYIRWLSKQGEMAPYLLNQLPRTPFQIHKGIHLGTSAFLLITIYSIIIIKIGKVHLPQHLELGHASETYWYMFIPILILNPVLEEWFWRLFLPKTWKLTYVKMQVLNVAYLLFHFSLFGHLLGTWKALVFVGTFFSVGRSMSHIKERFGIVTAVLTHYGITLSGVVIYFVIRVFFL